MAIKFNTTNGSITLDAADGTGNVDLSIPREGIQAIDANLAKYDAVTANFTGTLQNAGSNVVVDTDIGSTVQAFDPDTAKLDVAQTFTADQSFGNITLTGYLRGASSFVIDPAAHGDDTGTVVIAGNLQVDGTTTTINSTTVTVDDLNMVLASGSPNASAANGAGLTVDGASATFTYSSSDDRWNLNKPLNAQLFASGTVGIQEVIEKVTINTTTTGTFNFDALTQAVVYMTANQTANRTINFRGDGSNTLDSIMAVGESMSFAIAATEGSTAYYFNAIQVDGSSVTPKWIGGAPTAGVASSINLYSITVIKVSAASFTVLASLTAFE